MQTVKTLRSIQVQIVRGYTRTSIYGKRSIYRTVDEVLNYKGPGYRIFPEKIFYKLLFREKKKNGFFVHPPVGQPSILLNTVVECVGSSRTLSSRRVMVLNKLFMRYITEILTTSEIGMKIWEHNIQITHVKMSSSYSVLHVYWIPSGTEKDEEIQYLLNEIAHPLRSELISLHLMGRVPPIHFKKDKQYALMAEVDRRLKIADFGEDYVPVMFEEDSVKLGLQLMTPIPKKLKENILSLENKQGLTEEEEKELPQMRTDVFDLDREKIMSSIVNVMKRKQANKLASQAEETILGSSAITEVPFDLEAQAKVRNWDRSAFLNYLKSEKVKRKKMLKEQSKESQEYLLESSIMNEDTKDHEDEEYTEFVTNAFDDDFTCNDEIWEEKLEQEQ